MDDFTVNIAKELYRIGVAMTSENTLEDVMDTLVIETMRTLKVSAGSVALYDPKNDLLTLKASHGFSPKFCSLTKWKRRKGGMTDHILSKRIPTVIPDIKDYPFVDNKILLEEGVKSLVAIPLFANERTVGILYLDDFKPRQWAVSDVEFATLLGIQAAYAIEKFKLIEEISEARAYLENIFDASKDMIITTDAHGRIVEFNKGASEILGYSKEEMIEKKAETLWVRSDERREVLKILNKEGYVSNYETQLTTKNGTVIDVSLTLSYFKNGEGKVFGTVGISKDITEHKRLERAIEEKNLELTELSERLEVKVIERTRELEAANRSLEKSNKLKSQFIATMSHELRTPLNSILGFSELLDDEAFGLLTEKQKRFANNIYNSGNHLLQLINNILDIAKIESEKMELYYESFSVHQTVSGVETIIRSLADKKKQNLVVTIADNCSAIRADEVKFKQILYNLLSNAIKFTPEGGDITLKAEVISEDREQIQGLSFTSKTLTPQSLRLSVTDTGIGIEEGDHERIFSEFEQADSSFNRKYEGTGLGLALTKKLVELHGGEISVESPIKENKGSRFTIIIPHFIDTAATEKKIKMPPEPAKDEPIYGDSDIQKRRRGKAPLILIVEDDISISEMLTLYLTQGGYRVAHAYDGIEAMSRVKELRPFAVLLDIMLPKKNGWEVLQEIKLDSELRDIPVIMLPVIDNKKLGFALGATDCIIKPVDRAYLFGKLKNLGLATKKERKPVNILCIDDDKEVLDLLTSTLEPQGYTVTTANSGKRGIEMAAAFRPDFIILDLVMPEIDGFKVAQTLKSALSTMDIPILILTAKDMSARDRLALAGKAESCIQKSHFTKEDLLMCIRDIEITYPAKAGLLDDVSGLFDNYYFQIRLAQEISKAKRYKGTFSVIMIDLDNFTKYVKEHGIYRANVVIKKISDFLRKSIRGCDTVARCGIDEFGVIFTNTLKASAEVVTKRFLAYIESYPFYGEDIIPRGKITARASLISYPSDASSPEELIFKSHQALRKAKTSGGNTIEIYGK